MEFEAYTWWLYSTDEYYKTPEYELLTRPDHLEVVASEHLYFQSISILCEKLGYNWHGSFNSATT